MRKQKTDPYIYKEQKPFKSLQNKKNKSNKQLSLVQLLKNTKNKITPSITQEKLNIFKSMFGSIKLQQFAKIMVNNVRSQSFKYLSPDHFRILGDKSASQTYNYDEIEEENEEKDSNFSVNRCIKSIPFYYNIKEFINNSIPVFQPNSLSIVLWELIQLLIFLQLFFYICIKLITDINLNNLMDQNNLLICIILTLLDQAVQINLGLYIKGMYHDDRAFIFKHYIKNIFWIDSIIIIGLITEQYISKYFLCIYFYKIKNYFKFQKKVQETFYLDINVFNYLRLLKLLILVLFTAHVFSCFWIIVTFHNTKNWMVKLGIDQENWDVQYKNAVYYVIVTMCTVGYGDISPQNQDELYLCIVTILITCGVYAYTLNSIGVIFEELGQKQKLINIKSYVINKYLKETSISKELYYQVRQYLEYQWQKTDRDFELEKEILNELSYSLKSQIQREANRFIINECPVFNNNFSQDFRLKIIDIVKEVTFQPGQILDLDNNTSLFLIRSGKVELILQNKRKSKIYQNLKTMNKSDYLFAYNFFTGFPCKDKFRCIKFTNFITVDRNQFLDVLKKFPNDLEQFNYVKDQLLFNQNYRVIGVSCRSCKLYNHNTLRCPSTQYLPNKYRIIKQSQNKENVQRNNFERKKQQKFRIFNSLIQTVSKALNFFENMEDYIMDQSWILSDPEESQCDFENYSDLLNDEDIDNIYSDYNEDIIEEDEDIIEEEENQSKDSNTIKQDIKLITLENTDEDLIEPMKISEFQIQNHVDNQVKNYKINKKLTLNTQSTKSFQSEKYKNRIDKRKTTTFMKDQKRPPSISDQSKSPLKQSFSGHNFVYFSNKKYIESKDQNKSYTDHNPIQKQNELQRSLSLEDGEKIMQENKQKIGEDKISVSQIQNTIRRNSLIQMQSDQNQKKRLKSKGSIFMNLPPSVQNPSQLQKFVYPQQENNTVEQSQISIQNIKNDKKQSIKVEKIPNIQTQSTQITQQENKQSNDQVNQLEIVNEKQKTKNKKLQIKECFPNFDQQIFCKIYYPHQNYHQIIQKYNVYLVQSKFNTNFKDRKISQITKGNQQNKNFVQRVSAPVKTNNYTYIKNVLQIPIINEVQEVQKSTKGDKCITPGTGTKRNKQNKSDKNLINNETSFKSSILANENQQLNITKIIEIDNVESERQLVKSGMISQFPSSEQLNFE